MSIRRTRLEYTKDIMISRPVKKKKKIEKVKLPSVTKKEWQYNIPYMNLSGIVLAFTRSQAKGEIKKLHGIKGRVPIDSEIICVTN